MNKIGKLLIFNGLVFKTKAVMAAGIRRAMRIGVNCNHQPKIQTMSLIRYQFPATSYCLTSDRFSSLHEEVNGGRESHADGGRAGRVSSLKPLTNIVETKDAYVLEAELPGVAKDGLEVSVENGELTIVGRRATAAPEGRPVYRESRGGEFRRTFTHDAAVDAGRITAKLELGVLTLTLPKAESLKPRKIAVGD